MDTRVGGTIYCLLGAVFLAWALRAMWRGEIGDPDNGPLRRHNRPFDFYLLIIAFTSLALLLIATGVWSILHPGTFPVNPNADAD